MGQNSADENKKLRELLNEAIKTIERLRGFISDDSASARELKKEADSFLEKVKKDLSYSSGCLIAAIVIFACLILIIFAGLNI